MLPFLFVAAFAGAVCGVSFGIPKKAQTVVSSAYIVKLQVGSTLSERSNHDVAAHEAFHKRAANISYTVRREFTNSKLFYGVSIDVDEIGSDEVLRAKLS
jgi:hypothetical protein